MKKITLKDVAAKAGVSTALASYVLNNKLSARIKKDTAEKIKKAASELNYQPNRIARSLKLQRTNTIGLIVADIANPFSSYLARIIEDEAQKHDYILIIGSSDENNRKSQKLIDAFTDRQVDGFIITPVEHTEAQVQQLIDQRIPFVLVDRYFPDLETTNVTINNYAASKNAVQHLLDKGRSKIGIVAYKTELVHLNERLHGATDTLSENQCPTGDALTGWVNIDNIDEDVSNAVKKFLSKAVNADAIYFTSNKLAIAGLKVLAQLKIKVPEQVAIVSFDESDAFDLFSTPVTYIKQPLVEMGQEAVSLLIKKIKDTADTVTHSVFDATLIPRASTGVE
jgi:LacI family transcriptional regulator